MSAKDSGKQEDELYTDTPFELAITRLINIHETFQQMNGRDGDDRRQKLKFEFAKINMTHQAGLYF